MLGPGVKAALRHAIAWPLHASGASLRSLNGRVLILMYHRVVGDAELEEGFVQPGLYVHVSTFARQMGLLAREFDVLTFPELLAHWKGKRLSRRRRYCVVTFDDGWLDNYVHAYPVLRRFEIPATIFIPTALIGTAAGFWPEALAHLVGVASRAPKTRRRAEQVLRDALGDPVFKVPESKDGLDGLIERAKALRPDRIEALLDALEAVTGAARPGARVLLSWDEVAEMSRGGVAFGSHGATHRILTHLSPEAVREELVGSLADLRRRPINAVPVLAYPNGSFSPAIADAARAAGFEAAVSTRMGVEGRACGNLYALRRVGVHDDISHTVPLFTFQIAGMSRIAGARA